MQITVFGANGKVGRLVVGELLARHHQVVAVVHSKSPFTDDSNLRVVKGDVYLPRQVAEAVAGSQAVISTLGSWGTPGKDVLSVGMANIIPAMQANGIRRIVSLTGSGAFAAGDDISSLDSATHTLMDLAAGKVLRDGEQHIRLLQASGLDWTVLRSPVMTNGSVTAYRLQPGRPLPWATISRYTVAHAMADQFADASFLYQAPFIVRA